MRKQTQNFGNHRAPHDCRAGAALITVLGVSLILMIAGITLVVLSSQSMHRIKRTAQRAQAQAVAEAGIADMVAKLGANYTLWQNTNYMATFLSNGVYYVTTRLQMNSNVLITSDGIYMDASNRTIMEFNAYNNYLYDTNSAVLSDGLITLATAAYNLYGNVHANGDITLGNGTISGTVTAGGTVTPPSGGASNQPVRPAPEFNFDSYRQMATNGGTYLEGNQSLSGTPIAPATNGIMYVNGNLTIGNLSSFTGTIVVNGNITIINHFTQTSFPGTTNMPSLLSTGTIEIHNHTDLNGVVYARVNVILRNNTTINGGVISGGYTDIRNRITINSGGGYPIWDPLNPYVSLGGWLK